MEEREKWLDDLVKTALAEDAARKDATSRILVDASRIGDAVVRSGEPGVVSGHIPALETFRALDASLAYSAAAPDGARVQRGAVVARIYGHVRGILSAERTALNFFRHLSGVATLAAALAKLGSVHLPNAEIEVRSLDELRMMKESPPKRIMLDNFEPEAVRAAVAEIKGWAAVPEIEVSGGVNLDNVAAYAMPGVDFISVGALTSSAPALDMSLDLEGIDRK